MKKEKSPTEFLPLNYSFGALKYYSYSFESLERSGVPQKQ